MPVFALSAKTSPPIQIHYLDQGAPSAPPILLIHGVTCDLHDWSWQVPSPRRRPNQTARPPKVGIPSTLILDHSLGSTISYFLATTYPERVTALVTIDPYHNQPSEMRDPYINLFTTKGAETLEGWFAQFGYLGMAERGGPAPRWYTAWHAHRTLSMDNDILAGLAWGGWEAPDSMGRREVAGECYLSAEKEGEEKEGGGCGIKCPVLMVAAMEDNLVLERQMVKRKGERLDQVVVIEGRGLWLHQLFAAEEFNGILEGWFIACC